MKKVLSIIAIIACLSIACEESATQSPGTDTECPSGDGVLSYINIDGSACTASECTSDAGYLNNLSQNECPADYSYCGQDSAGKWYCAKSENDCLKTQHRHDSKCEDDTVDNCGAHGSACKNEMAGFKDGKCENGKCVADTCEDDYELDNGTCKASTPVNTCEDGQHDNAGECEVDSIENCGAHGKSCKDEMAGFKDGKCENGKCVADTCEDDYELDNGTCKASTPVNTCEDGQHDNAGECEVDSIENCGAHGNACVDEIPGFKEGKCEKGKCIADSCEEHYELKDGGCIGSCAEGQHNFETSCEDDSIDNCGAHGTACKLDDYPNSTELECTAGACAIKSCEAGYRLEANHCIEETSGTVSCNANEHPYNGGCEINSLENCGSHGTECSVSMVTGSKKVSCSKGVCEAILCIADYELKDGKCSTNSICSTGMFYCSSQNSCCSEKDCKGNCSLIGGEPCTDKQHEYLGKCEDNSLDNCGEHGKTCSTGDVANSKKVSCSTGSCEAIMCLGNYELKAGQCISDNICATGMYFCESQNSCCSEKDCKGNCAYIGEACTDTQHVYLGKCEDNSLDNCGAHGKTCSTANVANSLTVSCTKGSCIAAKCGPGYDFKDGQCVSNSICSSNMFYCSAQKACCSQKNCGGACTILGGDPCGTDQHEYLGKCEDNTVANCGSHGTECATDNGTMKCTNATCTIDKCNDGFHVYNNACEPDSDSNCGSHENTCSVANGTASCENATCKLKSCNYNYHIYSNGCEPDTLNNCGQHGTVCSTGNYANSASVKCSGGACILVSCNSGYTASGGKCVPNTSSCSKGMFYCAKDQSCCSMANCKGNCILN